ncbi:hypothetical protein B0H17DRAFT_1151212 [Mycena rosella]|uniref:Uncharacterized protein n=1 Tax=Mycena rosella TaxID=1033263 RepID=A0AAD7BMS6_MYCRO|nr:hypothetical protein B0H17DRAFT_1151212 [Mycena rosella]
MDPKISEGGGGEYIGFPSSFSSFRGKFLRFATKFTINSDCRLPNLRRDGSNYSSKILVVSKTHQDIAGDTSRLRQMAIRDPEYPDHRIYFAKVTDDALLDEVQPQPQLAVIPSSGCREIFFDHAEDTYFHVAPIHGQGKQTNTQLQPDLILKIPMRSLLTMLGNVRPTKPTRKLREMLASSS